VNRRVAYEIVHYKFRLFSPRFPAINRVIDVEKFGSLYGQKFLASELVGENPVLISGGVGEDVSFDIEFLTKFGGVAHFFDPTERAIQYFKTLSLSLGNRKTMSYTENGAQPIAAYDLTKITESSLHFYPLALLDRNQKVRFYQPLNKSHVSYSIQNIQNRFDLDGDYVDVEAIGPTEMMKLVASNEIDVMKLDIEGSEYYFLASLFQVKIFPHQILVEIDELSFPSLKSRRMAKKIFKLMHNNYYILIHRSGYEFTYLRK